MWLWACSPGSRIPLRKRAGPCAGVAPASVCAGARSEIKAGGWRWEGHRGQGGPRVPILVPHHDRGLGKARQLLHLKFINLTNTAAYLLCTPACQMLYWAVHAVLARLELMVCGGDRQASRQR